MEKSFEIRFPSESDYENLKALWKTSFDDAEESLASFFKKTVSTERVLAVFNAGNPVSALYMLESEIVKDKKTYSAYYIYAVCTHYLFLVPEEDYLFRVYEKLGFKNGFSYSKKTLSRKTLNDIENIKTQKFTYENYRKCIEKNPKEVPFAILKETTFNSFFNSISGEVKTVFVEGEGYALYEETEDKLIIFELFGNKNLLLNAVFSNTEKEEIIYRQTANENPVPYGMFYKLNDVPEIQNGFFGIPYAN